MRRIAVLFLLLFAVWVVAAEWYVHHPRKWIAEHRAKWPRAVTLALEWLGNPVGDLTDGLGWTGRDAVAKIQRGAPSNEILFAGLPVRKGPPAPDDIKILDKGDFIVGWSPKLKHPAWCAYHVPAKALFAVTPRPSFNKDKSVPSSPFSSAYSRSGYDRGHMVPNYATVTRFGPEAQQKTFLTTNIAPQTPRLNQGVWRDIEHRIAEFWTAKWGEIWVIVGAVSDGQNRIGYADIDVPRAFYQVIVAQKDDEIRAVAVMIEQKVPWRDWPTRHIVTIDELEEATGLDFLPELDDDIEDAIEAERPTRLWPVRFWDAFKMLMDHNK